MVCVDPYVHLQYCVACRSRTLGITKRLERNPGAAPAGGQTTQLKHIFSFFAQSLGPRTFFSAFHKSSRFIYYHTGKAYFTLCKLLGFQPYRFSVARVLAFLHHGINWWMALHTPYHEGPGFRPIHPLSTPAGLSHFIPDLHSRSYVGGPPFYATLNAMELSLYPTKTSF